MTTRRLLTALSALALAALLTVGLVQLSSRATPQTPTLALTPAQIRTRLAGSPAPLAALHTQANELLSGGKQALTTRLAALHGRPIVINKWASWCVPCRSEFGSFQRASVTLGRQVAFIGIDSHDYSQADARAFLRKFPVSYPSYYDSSGALGAAITDSTSMPVTVFYNTHGSEYIHQGPYPNLAELERDIKRYALNPTKDS
jgi:cytochrome c biogenesis protein CcmG/thiol:disulfide interchange protein DsbE